MTSSSQAPQSVSPRVLLVDDEAAVLRMVKTMLTRANYEVQTASSAAAGMKALAEQGPFNCVITDAVMPEMTGYDLVKMIRKHPDHSGVPVLMLTRKRHRQDVKKAVDAGVTDYVLKPIDEHLLLDKVELCLKKAEAKRHIFECPINGKSSEAKLTFQPQIVALSESDFTLRSPVPIPNQMPFQFRAQLFEEIGIVSPMIKPMSMREVPEATPDGHELPYEIKLSFIGLPDADLRKIRAWIQKEEIRRRK